MDVFFVLSGFLITYIILKMIETLNIKGIIHFYFKRSFRVLPLYYFVFGLIYFMPRYFEYDHKFLINELFFLSNYPFSVRYLMEWSWSLSVEEHFYIVAPLFLFLWYKIKVPRVKMFILFLIWLGVFFWKMIAHID
jgi:peptidoglycan/LPS O-acetylase OafA/YrhL